MTRGYVDDDEQVETTSDEGDSEREVRA